MNTAQKSSRRIAPGCVISGCLTALVLCGGIVLLIYFYAKRTISSHLSDAPKPLAAVVIEAEKGQDVITRFDSFMMEQSRSLDLSSNEMNYLITQHPRFAKAKEVVRLEFSGKNRVRAIFSAPVDSLGFKGKYVNADGEFLIGFGGGKLSATVQSLELNGWKMNADLIKELSKTDVLEGLEANEAMDQLTKSLKVLQIEKDSLHVER